MEQNFFDDNLSDEDMYRALQMEFATFITNYLFLDHVAKAENPKKEADNIVLAWREQILQKHMEALSVYRGDLKSQNTKVTEDMKARLQRWSEDYNNAFMKAFDGVVKGIEDKVKESLKPSSE